MDSYLDSMTHRRDASTTKDSEVTDSPWPVVTRSLLKDHEKLEASHTPEEVNQGVFTLIKARKALGDARLAIGHAKRMNKGNASVVQRLEVIALEIEIEQQRFPLTVMA